MTTTTDMILAIRAEAEERFDEGWDVLLAWPDDALARQLSEEDCTTEEAALECALQIATHGLLPLHRKTNYPAIWRL